MTSRALRLLLVAVALAVACLSVYAVGLRGSFLMDDFDAIFPLLAAKAQGATWWDVLLQAPNHIRARWLSNLSFLMTQAATGAPWPPSPFAFKLGNLALHLGCAVVIALLGTRLALRWGADATRATWIGLFAAALFALHPLLVSTVLYPVQRMAQLATLFALLATLAYVRWRESLPTTPRRHAIGVAAVLLLIAAAISSKESGVLAPLLIGVIELTAFRWPAKQEPHRAAFESGFGLLCAAPLVLGTVLLGLRWTSLTAGYAGRDFSLVERLLTQLHVLVDYLGQIVWPRIASMGLYRDDFPLTSRIDLSTAAIGIFFAAAIVAALVLRRRWPAVAFAVLWFFAAHALESTVLPLELVFEHRNYLALFGPALAVAWALAKAPPRVAFALGCLALAALGTQTLRRAQDWSSYDRWIRAEAAHHPGSLRAGTDLVVHLAANAEPVEGSRALEALRRHFPDHAQPAIVALVLRCHASQTIALGTPPDDLLKLRRGKVGKDAFHSFSGVRDSKMAGRCEGVSWPALAEVAHAVASNPAVTAYPRAAAAWQRLDAQAQAQAGNWPAAAASTERALAIEDNDPNDWLLLMEARLRGGDLRGYGQARMGLLQLTAGQLGSLGPQVAALDETAARLSRAANEAPPIQ